MGTDFDFCINDDSASTHLHSETPLSKTQKHGPAKAKLANILNHVVCKAGEIFVVTRFFKDETTFDIMLFNNIFGNCMSKVRSLPNMTRCHVIGTKKRLLKELLGTKQTCELASENQIEQYALETRRFFREVGNGKGSMRGFAKELRCTLKDDDDIREDLIEVLLLYCIVAESLSSNDSPSILE